VVIIGLGVLATIYCESGGNPKAVGDAGHSIGLLQMHDQGSGAGMSVAERENPDTQFRHARQIMVALETELYWSRVENRPFNPGKAIQSVQRSIDSAGTAYTQAYHLLRREAGLED
jgi:hypothetical protein